MNPLRELAYRAKVLLLNLYGPASLDEEHDPVAQLKREHQAEEAAEASQPEPGPEPGGRPRA